jgi:hypothetical protein
MLVFGAETVDLELVPADIEVGAAEALELPDVGSE